MLSVLNRGTAAPGALKPWLLLLPLVLFLCAFFLVPLGQVALMSVTEPEFGLGNYAHLTSDGLYLQVFLNTFLTALGVALCCLLLGYPLAYLMAQSSPRVAALLMLLVTMSFWTSFLVRTYAWMVLLGNNGPVTAFLAFLGWDPPPHLLFTRLSSTLAMVHILIPYMVMSLYSVMKRIDPALLRAAESLGARPWSVFRQVYLPLSAPGMVNGATLVFMICLGFYVTPVLLGSPQEQMVAGLIGTQIEEFLDFGQASAMAMVLLASTLIVLTVYHRRFGLDRLWG
ncbi:ABC transporter permease [Azospirillum rugosum]|uniref:Spermidine/putrescine transport system permease protein n=1 Tax=Azospirillum rugosum TaxID=416170 RepID=A0ABS4SUH7_9PROT|nr:ABC transporter permease [Azospirillum rugosum]MBP2296223.1 putative spermidine/putrescine transport system permease protein [Azospirillum rugosum]MDQ0527092.1 putative spermidine/putrescine transport system permease protein [Azospirillum rugosum]